MNINRRADLQGIIAEQIQRDIKRLDELHQLVKEHEQSKFEELVVETLLKAQNTRQVVISKQLTDSGTIVPYYKGNKVGSFNFSPLQSQLLTEKYLDLFYELFDRQKNKTGVKQYKKEPCNANW